MIADNFITYLSQKGGEGAAKLVIEQNHSLHDQAEKFKVAMAAQKRYIDSLQAALKLSDESREKLKEEVDGIKEHRNQMVRQIKAWIIIFENFIQIRIIEIWKFIIKLYPSYLILKKAYETLRAAEKVQAESNSNYRDVLEQKGAEAEGLLEKYKTSLRNVEADRDNVQAQLLAKDKLLGTKNKNLNS